MHACNACSQPATLDVTRQLDVAQIHTEQASKTGRPRQSMQGLNAWRFSLCLSRLQVVHTQAKSFGCTAELDWLEKLEPYYPATVNDDRAYEFAMGVADK